MDDDKDKLLKLVINTLEDLDKAYTNLDAKYNESPIYNIFIPALVILNETTLKVIRMYKKQYEKNI